MTVTDLGLYGNALEPAPPGRITFQTRPLVVSIIAGRKTVPLQRFRAIVIVRLRSSKIQPVL